MAEPSPPHASEVEPSDPPPLARPPKSAKAPGAYLRLPLWQRFALAALITVALLVALVLYVDRHNTDSPPSTNPAGEVAANREAEILVAQDQAPRTDRIARGEPSRAALTRTIRTDMSHRINSGALEGPLQRVHCRAAGPPGGSRQAFSCNVLAGSIAYQFLGVVDEAKSRVTYCKRDPPPAPSDNVAVSSRCTR